MEDACLRCGVSSAHLVHLKGEEDKLAKGMLEHADRLLPPLERSAALRCMSRLLHMAIQCQNGWCKTALLLDRYCVEADISLELLPATCVAIVRIVSKMEHRAYPGIPEICWKVHADELCTWLTSAGYNAPEVTESILLEQEQEMMRVLQWRVTEPCAQQWSLAFFTRFALLAGQGFHRNLQQMEKKLLALAKAVIMCREASSSLTHGMLSCGLLCLCIVEAGLVPLMDLQPEDLSAQDWIDLYLQSQPNGVQPICNLTASQREHVRQLLTMSTCTGLPELKASAQRAGGALGTALRGIRQVQQEIQARTHEAIQVDRVTSGSL